jgi:hypothetical protein
MLLLANGVQAQQAAATATFTFEEVMIPMRDRHTSGNRYSHADKSTATAADPVTSHTLWPSQPCAGTDTAKFQGNAGRLYLRDPQARATDNVKTTQRVYCSASLASRIVLPVVRL